MNSLPDKIGAIIEKEKLLKPRQSVLVAVSGGLDSMVLLECLHRLAGLKRWQLTVAHFNHQLRGPESEDDELLVRAAAARMRLQVECGRGDVRARMAQDTMSVEMAARDLRHEFLGRTAARLGIRVIALAHHADDQAELFFLRLFRGAGAGLGGMKWSSPSPSRPGVRLVRPLLGVGKSDLSLFARLEGVAWREDASNGSREILRNRVRVELLPLLEKNFDGSIRTAILRSMDIIGQDTDFAEAAARGWLKQGGVVFGKLHAAVQRHVLRLQLIGLGITPEFEVIERLRHGAGRIFSADAGAGIYRDKNGRVKRRVVLRGFDSVSVSVEVKAASGRIGFEHLTIGWRRNIRSAPGALVRAKGVEVFDASKIGAVVELRHWRMGDRFQPIGMRQPVKLQDLFINAKIPRARRHELVVAVAARGAIFWVEGLRMGEQFKLTARTRETLTWRWRTAGRKISLK